MVEEVKFNLVIKCSLFEKMIIPFPQNGFSRIFQIFFSQKIIEKYSAPRSRKKDYNFFHKTSTFPKK